MDVLLAALGTNSYTPTRYDGYEIESPYFTYALIRKHDPAKVILLLTQAAKKMHWDAERYDYKDKGDTKSHPTLRKVLEGSVYGQNRVNIPEGFPDGRDEGELWAAFNIIIEAVPENCTLILDVTNGFRTLPMLMLLAAIYLRQAKNVTLKGIYYGAFEAKSNDDQGRDVCPVFELTQFITLADWANAVRAFKLTGDTALLAESLSGLSETGSQERLKSASEHLKTFATYLDLGLSLEVQAASAQLREKLQAAEAALAERHAAFKTLLEQVRDELESFAQAAPRNLDQMKETLKRQLRLIHWLKKKRIATATLLTQEWIVSWEMVKQEKQKRIFEWAARKIKNPQIEALSKLRNQLAHGGWTADPLNVEEAVDTVERIIDALQEDTVIPETAPKPQPSASGEKPAPKRKPPKKKSQRGKKPKRG
ncbi:MAG: TIGR02221 family CRISPR-associated protein [Chloroflexi bacterium CFX4]|nr:TIGR02221 family CRISPR-associated protein [Chloroflexi bacterium CFX4]MDL1924232.1 TIGR02221 family CRISPR-associated protein [Chloroflexi bacterium CFX3]